VVTPAKAGVQKPLKRLDSRSPTTTFGDRLRGNERKRGFLTFYEPVNLDELVKKPYTVIASPKGVAISCS
jgi:hypothetical protein